jgi:hypothetical protein
MASKTDCPPFKALASVSKYFALRVSIFGSAAELLVAPRKRRAAAEWGQGAGARRAFAQLKRE